MIAIIDYGAGNLHSVQKAVEFVGGRSFFASTAEEIFRADKVVLPGVGAFQIGMTGLTNKGLVPAIKEYAATGRPLLGICLGMQLLFEESDEGGQHFGLGLLPGDVVAFEPIDLKVPQIGWNQLVHKDDIPLLANVKTGSYVYFNHSYYCRPSDPSHIFSTTEYGDSFASIVASGNVYGFQFHPEKSQRVGLQLLQNFIGVSG
jgi:glutamine amidotransferase